ncbi:MAG: hypothetical protein ACJ8AW_08500, partial [Rhodopila sp.]
ILLPLQLHVWGQDYIAKWFVLFAAASLVGGADLGLRGGGHDALLASRRGDPAARAAFRPIWALTRGLFVGLTTLFLLYQWHVDRASFALMSVVTLSTVLDGLAIVRGIWCDTLGHFNRVEGVYCAASALRTALLAVALWVFAASPIVAAVIMLLTALGLLITQALVLPIPELSLRAGGFSELRLGTLLLIRWLMAEPLNTWMRINLPVIILAGLAPSAIVTTYVAIRTVLGVPRQVVIQLSRFISVLYVTQRDCGSVYTDRLVRQGILAVTLIALLIGSVLMADNGRMLRRWLHGSDLYAENAIVLSGAVITAGLGMQLITMIMVRSGEVVEVGKRNYAYLLAGFVAAALGRYVFGSPDAYLALITAQEWLIAGLFALRLESALRHLTFAAWAVALLALAVMRAIVSSDPWGVFQSAAPLDWVVSMLYAATSVVCVAGLFLLLDRLAGPPTAAPGWT